MTAIKVNYADRKIVLSSAFAKKCFTPGSVEYAQLQSVRSDYPDFALVTRKFKTNTAQEHYRGLTYDFMREYIETNDRENASANLKALDTMIGHSKCHSKSKRYPSIKKWFFETYPEIAEFGMNEEQLAKWRAKQEAKKTAESAKVTTLPSSDEEKIPA